MVVLNALDDALRCLLQDELLRSGDTDEQLADRTGIGLCHLTALLDGEEAFTSRDLMLLAAAGFEVSPGLLSGRRGYRDVRPMVFVPRDGCSVQWCDHSAGIGVDVVVEDIDGRSVTQKLSVGVARAIAHWVADHDPAWRLEREIADDDG